MGLWSITSNICAALTKRVAEDKSQMSCMLLCSFNPINILKINSLNVVVPRDLWSSKYSSVALHANLKEWDIRNINKFSLYVQSLKQYEYLPLKLERITCFFKTSLHERIPRINYDLTVLIFCITLFTHSITENITRLPSPYFSPVICFCLIVLKPSYWIQDLVWTHFCLFSLYRKGYQSFITVKSSFILAFSSLGWGQTESNSYIGH